LHYLDFTRQASDGLPLYFQGWEPEGQPKAIACLVHGLGEHSGRYAHVGAALTEAGYALLGFDLRGHGRSGGKRGHTPSFETLMDDIGRLLGEAGARYAGQPRFLYGHSLGGGLALNYVLRRRPQIKGVIATSPWLRLSYTPSAAKVRAARIMNRLSPGFTQSSGLNAKDLSHDPEVVRAYEGDPLVHDRISARLAMAMLDAGEWAIAHAAEFPPIPLLLVHGTGDRITSAQATQAFAAKVPGECTLKLWEGLYHETHNEPEKREVLGYTIRWMDEHMSGREEARE
jgi:alpha-beta hydrolase superfamily lysophospholipase